MNELCLRSSEFLNTPLLFASFQTARAVFESFFASVEKHHNLNVAWSMVFNHLFMGMRWGLRE